jgi:hypothetical protein
MFEDKIIKPVGNYFKRWGGAIKSTSNQRI